MVRILCMFQRMKDLIWMESQNNVSSLFMGKMSLVTSCMKKAYHKSLSGINGKPNY